MAVYTHVPSTQASSRLQGEASAQYSAARAQASVPRHATTASSAASPPSSCCTHVSPSVQARPSSHAVPTARGV